MLSILGMGSAYPREEHADKSSGATTRLTPCRTSVLPEKYLNESGNKDFLAAPLVATETPTDLAERAARIALERAGITPDQLGLIIGDCATPREKTPSEAQRLGKRFGLKVAAFDVTCGTTAFVQHLDTLNNWRADKVPEYVLLVSSNSPTENLTVEQRAKSPLRFCDAASALVVSKRHPGKMKVVASMSSADPKYSEILTIDTFGGLNFDFAAAEEYFASYIDRALSEVTEKNLVRQGGFRLVCSMGSKSTLDAIANAFQVEKGDRWYEDIIEQGDSLGSSVGRILADRWDRLGDGRNVVVAVCGSGMKFGYVVLE